MNTRHTNRRSFLGKIAAAGSAIALAGSLPGKLQAAANPPATPRVAVPWVSAPPETAPFVSDKKFVPVMLTPYSDDGKIDFDGLSRLIDFYLAAGVKGFFANCLSSEMYNLDAEERLALARHTVKRVNGKVSVVATGSFGETLEEKAAFTLRQYHTGVNAVILISSHLALEQESDSVLLSNFEKFCRLTDNIPLGMYECPSPYKRLITPALFTSLLATDRLIYHKDTSIDFEKVRAKLALVGNNRIEFYDAHTPNARYSLQAGAKGMSAIAGNFYPEILVWMCNNATNPARQKEVEWLQTELTKADPIISDGYPLSAKYFLRKRGVPIRVLSRARTSPLTKEQEQNLDGIYKSFQVWCTRLSIQPAV